MLEIHGFNYFPKFVYFLNLYHSKFTYHVLYYSSISLVNCTIICDFFAPHLLALLFPWLPFLKVQVGVLDFPPLYVVWVYFD